MRWCGLAVHTWWSRKNERLFEVSGTAPGDFTREMWEQMAYFSSTLDEIFSTLLEFLPADRILFVRHPHLRHMHPDNMRRTRMNREVGPLVAGAVARGGAYFYDAQSDLAALFGDHPEAYYWNGFTHVNFDGMRAYGDLIGRELLAKIEKAGSRTEPPQWARTAIWMSGARIGRGRVTRAAAAGGAGDSPARVFP